MGTDNETLGMPPRGPHRAAPGNEPWLTSADPSTTADDGSAPGAPWAAPTLGGPADGGSFDRRPLPAGTGSPFRMATRGATAWVLLLPAAIALLLGQVIPTVSLIARSLGGDPVADYEAVLTRSFAPLVTVAAASLVPALFGFVIGHGTGRLLARSGRAVAIGTAILGALLVTVAPASTALGTWASVDRLADAPSMLLFLLTVTWLPATLVAGVVVGATTAGGSGLRASLVAGAVTCLSAIALGLQAFSPTLLAARTPMSDVHQLLLMLDLNRAAALGVVLLVPCMALGVIVTLVLLTSRLRLELAPSAGHGAVGAVAGGGRPPPGFRGARPQVPAGRDGRPNTPAGRDARRQAPRPMSSGEESGTVGLVVAVIIAVGLVVLAWPWLSQLGSMEVAGSGGAAGPMLRTGGGAVAQGVLAVVIGGCGAYAIGYLRPLGEASERLLLICSPWLLVGVGSLIVEYIWFFQQLGRALPVVAPQVLVVPALFLLTYVFAAARRAGARPVSVTTMASALLTGTLVAWLTAQNTLWGVLATGPATSALSAVVRSFQLTFSHLPLGYLTPIPVVLLVAAIFAATVPILARMRLRLGPPMPSP